MSRPRLLDLFCGAGGASVGYHRAGFDVVGVDVKPQPNYPFRFIQMDALKYLGHIGEREATAHWQTAHDFDAIHASPPCQRYSTATKRNGTELEHPDLIGPTRELLQATGLPYVIENVVGAPIRQDYLLCGSYFYLEADGYRLKRHRAFEVSWPVRYPNHSDKCYCAAEGVRPVMDVTGGGPTKKPRTDGKGGRPYKGTADQARRIMGIDWMTKAELNEAIPPAYTEFIGAQLLDHIRARAAA